MKISIKTLATALLWTFGRWTMTRLYASPKTRDKAIEALAQTIAKNPPEITVITFCLYSDTPIRREIMMATLNYMKQKYRPEFLSRILPAVLANEVARGILQEFVDGFAKKALYLRNIGHDVQEGDPIWRRFSMLANLYLIFEEKFPLDRLLGRDLIEALDEQFTQLLERHSVVLQKTPELSEPDASALMRISLGLEEEVQSKKDYEDARKTARMFVFYYGLQSEALAELVLNLGITKTVLTTEFDSILWALGSKGGGGSLDPGEFCRLARAYDRLRPHKETAQDWKMRTQLVACLMARTDRPYIRTALGQHNFLAPQTYGDTSAIELELFTEVIRQLGKETMIQFYASELEHCASQPIRAALLLELGLGEVISTWDLNRLLEAVREHTIPGQVVNLLSPMQLSECEKAIALGAAAHDPVFVAALQRLQAEVRQSA